jgi:MFS family permease
MNSFILTIVLAWLLVFFGGAILPTVTGIMINTVEPNQKTSANSLANLSYNLIGYLPAPSIYGAVSAATGSPKIALATILYMTAPIGLMLFVGIRRKLYLEE